MSQRCYYAITTFTDTNTVLEREREMWPPAFRDGNVSGESDGESIQEEAVVQIGAKNYLETIQVQYITFQYSTVQYRGTMSSKTIRVLNMRKQH